LEITTGLQAWPPGPVGSNERRTVPGRISGQRSFNLSRANTGPPARSDRPAR